MTKATNGWLDPLPAHQPVRHGRRRFIAVPMLAREASRAGRLHQRPLPARHRLGRLAWTASCSWTRLAPKPFEIQFGMGNQPVEVDWEVASDEAFASIVQSGEGDRIADSSPTPSTSKSRASSPNRPYFYRFRAGGVQSPLGRAKTLPALGSSVAHVKFAVAGCQSFPTGFYTAYKPPRRRTARLRVLLRRLHLRGRRREQSG